MEYSRSDASERERWCLQRVDFVLSVVNNVNREFVRNKVMSCMSDNDVEILIQKLMEDGYGGNEGTSHILQEATGYYHDNLDEPAIPDISQLRTRDTNEDIQQVSTHSRETPQNRGAKRKEEIRNQNNGETTGQGDEDIEAKVMAQVVCLADIFKDADPDFLQARCWEIRGDQNRLKSLIKELSRKKDYPKLNTYLQRQKETEFQKFIESLSVQEYLSFIEGPKETESEPREQECGICCNDVSVKDMISCDAILTRHRFCCDCVKKFVEEEIGQGRSRFRCPEVECKGVISEENLKHLLSEAVLTNIMQRRQQEEITNAAIDDLESCPFCDFKIIMPNKSDRVFICQNPGCMKDSCRLCKELNHIPKTCREVLAEKQKDVRTLLENRMAEAIIRECFRCKKRFIIEAGCNKMTCSCGAIMCYLCKQPIHGYDHFTNYPQREPNKCPLWTDSVRLHGNEVMEAAAQAKNELDPDLDLVHDPTRDLS